MANLKALLLRIKSIRSIQKTTKVMQMISAAKLHRVQQRLDSAKKYLAELHSIIDHTAIAEGGSISGTSCKCTVLLIIMSSDRGLCGNFNNMVIKFAKSYIKKIGIRWQRGKISILRQKSVLHDVESVFRKDIKCIF
ncbi:MAG: F0F1 ATP synthase subunit gamma [Ehrlichia sp.]